MNRVAALQLEVSVWTPGLQCRVTEPDPGVTVGTRECVHARTRVLPLPVHREPSTAPTSSLLSTVFR